MASYKMTCEDPQTGNSHTVEFPNGFNEDPSELLFDSKRYRLMETARIEWRMPSAPDGFFVPQAFFPYCSACGNQVAYNSTSSSHGKYCSNCGRMLYEEIDKPFTEDSNEA